MRRNQFLYEGGRRKRSHPLSGRRRTKSASGGAVTHRPAWDDSLTDLTRYRATPDELVNRAVGAISPHNVLARVHFARSLARLAHDSVNVTVTTAADADADGGATAAAALNCTTVSAWTSGAVSRPYIAHGLLTDDDDSSAAHAAAAAAVTPLHPLHAAAVSVRQRLRSLSERRRKGFLHQDTAAAGDETVMTGHESCTPLAVEDRVAHAPREPQPVQTVVATFAHQLHDLRQALDRWTPAPPPPPSRPSELDQSAVSAVPTRVSTATASSSPRLLVASQSGLAARAVAVSPALARVLFADAVSPQPSPSGLRSTTLPPSPASPPASGGRNGHRSTLIAFGRGISSAAVVPPPPLPEATPQVRIVHGSRNLPAAAGDTSVAGSTPLPPPSSEDVSSQPSHNVAPPASELPAQQRPPADLPSPQSPDPDRSIAASLAVSSAAATRDVAAVASSPLVADIMSRYEARVRALMAAHDHGSPAAAAADVDVFLTAVPRPVPAASTPPPPPQSASLSAPVLDATPSGGHTTAEADSSVAVVTGHSAGEGAPDRRNEPADAGAHDAVVSEASRPDPLAFATSLPPLSQHVYDSARYAHDEGSAAAAATTATLPTVTTPRSAPAAVSTHDSIAKLRHYLDRLRHNAPASSDAWSHASAASVSAAAAEGGLDVTRVTVVSASAPLQRMHVREVDASFHGMSDAGVPSGPSIPRARASSTDGEAPLPSTSVPTYVGGGGHTAGMAAGEAPTLYAYYPSQGYASPSVNPHSSGGVGLGSVPDVAGTAAFRTPQPTPPRDSLGRSRPQPTTSTSASGVGAPSRTVEAAGPITTSQLRWMRPSKPGLPLPTTTQAAVPTAPSRAGHGREWGGVARDLFGAASSDGDASAANAAGRVGGPGPDGVARGALWEEDTPLPRPTLVGRRG